MNISPISAYNYNSNCFKANDRWVHNAVGSPIFKTTTYFFRDDIDWKKLINFLCLKYKNTEKINVLNHACSNGMEPYSLVMQFLHSKPEDAKKFFPITAKDLDHDNIYAATTGQCGASTHDQRRAQVFLDYSLWDFVDWQKSTNPNNDMILSPKQFVKDQINFSQGNIFNDIDNLPNKNNVILCRNMWLYLNPQEQDSLLKKLSDKLDATSTVILGLYDFLNNYKLKLDFDYYGFKEDMPYVFSKNC